MNGGSGADAFALCMGPVALELLGEPTERSKSGTEWRWGSRGSLMVLPSKGVFQDHAAGVKGGVLALLQHERNLDKPAALDWLRERGHLPDDSPAVLVRRRQVAAYDYLDAAGVLTFQVVRFDPKDFRQRRPDGAGGWVWNVAGVQLVPYRLPDMLAAVKGGRTVFVVEGEKAADRLAAQGLAATCSPGGAGKWREAYGAHLDGASVVILADNDDVGRAHADQVARSLRGHAVRIRILELPGLPLKGDVADWLDAGGTPAELAEIAAKAPLRPAAAEPVPQPTAEIPPRPAAEGQLPYSPALAEFLSARAWSEREFPPTVRLLGDVVTQTSRTFLIGATGLGKTLLGVAIAAGMATGTGFLDWRCDRPARVLYIDGEMPGELVKARVRDEMRRIGSDDLSGNLFVFCADMADAIQAIYPQVGPFEPLNTEGGQRWLFALIQALGGVDAVIFDNVMSLVSGDQKDEVPWTETLPLVSGLTRRQIGQVWLDHAGHNTARQYGSSTKAWRFDAVGVMTELPEDQRSPRETAFKLSFDPPGKARRRTPDNWEQFAPRTIRLANDQWTGERAEPATGPGTGEGGGVAPSRRIFHDALLDALVAHSTKPGQTTLAAWEAECARRGMIEPPEAKESGARKGARTAKLRTAKSALLAAGWIGIDGEYVTNLHRTHKG